MFGFDNIFDFDHDGHLDAVERDAEYQFMYEMTKSGESDSFDDEEDVFAELITTRPFSVIVSEKNPLAKKDAVHFKELADQEFINYDQQYVHQSAFQAYCAYAQIKPKIIVYRLPNVSWVKELVRQDKGISVMVKDAATNEPGIKALDILDPIPEKFYISIVTREGYVLSDDEKDFVERIKKLHLDD